MGALWIAAMVLGLGAAPKGDRAAIEGQLRYPSCSEVPEDLVICAEPASGGGAARCVRPSTGAEGAHYRLELPGGVYRVFATAETVRPGYRAYYSAAVVCGLRVGCGDHSPLEVLAVPGRTRGGIDPADWFVRQMPEHGGASFAVNP
jgi:hypothetical protein